MQILISGWTIMMINLSIYRRRNNCYDKCGGAFYWPFDLSKNEEKYQNKKSILFMLFLFLIFFYKGKAYVPLILLASVPHICLSFWEEKVSYIILSPL